MGDTSLSTFIVGTVAYDPTSATSVTLPPGTSSVPVNIETENAEAEFVINLATSANPGNYYPVSLGLGGTLPGLQTGINSIRVDVTAPDNSTGSYYFEVIVSNSGVINGDPYVTTFAGVHYKLPSIDAPIRYFQTMEDGKLLTINAQLKTCSSADLDVSNIRSLLALKNKMTAKQYSVIAQKLMTPETLSFFERVYIQYGDESLVVNLWNSKFEVLKNNLSVKAKVVDRPDLIEKTGIYTGYKASTLKFTFGTTKLFLSVYDSPMIRNGLSVETCAKNCNGVIVNALKQSDMVLPVLDSVIPVAKKDSAKRHVHSETFVDHDGLRTRNIVTYR